MGFRLSSLFPLAGLALFAFLLSLVDLGELIGFLSRVDAPFFVFALLVNNLTLFLKAWRWQKICRFAGFELDFWSASRYWLASFSLGAVTPGKVGDLSRAFYLKRSQGVPFSRAFFTVFLDRVFDVFVLVAIGGVAVMSLLSTSFVGEAAVVSLVGFFAAFSAFLLLLSREGLVGALLRPVFYFLVPEKYRAKVKLNFRDFYSFLPTVKKSPWFLLQLSVMSLLPWLVSIYSYYLMAASLNMSVDLLFLSQVIPVVFLAELLPFSFSGLGTRDVALVGFFSLRGLETVQALSFSIGMVAFHVFYVAVGFALLSLDRPKMEL